MTRLGKGPKALFGKALPGMNEDLHTMTCGNDQGIVRGSGIDEQCFLTKTLDSFQRMAQSPGGIMGEIDQG